MRPSGWSKTGKVVGLVRKAVVKVVLSKEQRELLVALASRLGTSESEALRLALMDYVKEVSLMSEALHRKRSSDCGT